VQDTRQHEIKPHKVRYYLERRDPEFAAKMAEVLCVYREVALLREAAAERDEKGPSVAIISFDEKPGMQAIATTGPDLPPEPLRHQTIARDHEYVRLGTLTLLAGIDLLTGVVHASVEERHRSREFVEFLKQLGTAEVQKNGAKAIEKTESPTKVQLFWTMEAKPRREACYGRGAAFSNSAQ
jgi:hypothetical protein